MAIQTITVGTLKTMLYASLSQQWASYLVGNNAIYFINLALTDIYNYQGRYWSFQYMPQEIIPGTDTRVPVPYTVTGSYFGVVSPPIVRVSSLRKMNTHTTGTPYGREKLDIQFLQSTTLTKEHDIHYQMYDNTITVFDNLQWYVLNYIAGMRFLSSDTDIIPLPITFIGALHSLCLSYMYVPFGQYGDQKEVNKWQQAMQQLGMLAQADAPQLSLVTSCIN